MASDDMHVVMYKILSYLYACMKAGEKPKAAKYSAEALGINKPYWDCIVAELACRGFVAGIKVTRSEIGDSVYLSNPRVTMEGVEFLMENSMMKRAKKFLAEIKEAVPFV